MDVSLRSCTDSLADRECLAWTLNEGSRGLVKRILGEDAIDIVAKASLVAGQDVSYQNVDLAEADGRLVGAVSHFDPELSSSPEAAVLHALDSDPLLSRAEAFARLFQANRRHGAGEWHVQSVAVLPEYRHRGVASALIEKAESAARVAGSSALTLDVSDANAEAIRLYSELGFVEEFRISGSALSGFEGSIRMKKNLY